MSYNKDCKRHGPNSKSYLQDDDPERCQIQTAKWGSLGVSKLSQHIQTSPCPSDFHRPDEESTERPQVWNRRLPPARKWPGTRTEVDWISFRDS